MPVRPIFEQTAKSGLESKRILTVDGVCLSAQYSFLVQRFHNFDSKDLGSYDLSMKMTVRSEPGVASCSAIGWIQYSALRIHGTRQEDIRFA